MPISEIIAGWSFYLRQIEFEHVHCGYGELESSLREFVQERA